MGLEVEKVQGQFIVLKIDSLFQQTCVEMAPGAHVLTTLVLLNITHIFPSSLKA